MRLSACVSACVSAGARVIHRRTESLLHPASQGCCCSCGGISAARGKTKADVSPEPSASGSGTSVCARGGSSSVGSVCSRRAAMCLWSLVSPARRVVVHHLTRSSFHASLSPRAFYELEVSVFNWSSLRSLSV